MSLAIRMFLYFISAAAAGQGIAVYDAEAGTITFELESLALALGGLLTFAGTFVAGRFAKVK